MSSRAADIEPLPEALLVAADLRRQARKMVLMAERLEASVPQPERREKGDMQGSIQQIRGIVK